VGLCCLEKLGFLIRQRVPNFFKFQRSKILGVGGRKGFHSEVAEGESQPDVDDAAKGESRFLRPLPDGVHDRSGFDDPPVAVFPQSLAIKPGVLRGHGMAENFSVAQLEKNFDQHQFADEHICSTAQILEKFPGGIVKGRIGIGRVDDNIGIEADHASSRVAMSHSDSGKSGAPRGWAFGSCH